MNSNFSFIETVVKTYGVKIKFYIGKFTRGISLFPFPNGKIFAIEIAENIRKSTEPSIEIRSEQVRSKVDGPNGWKWTVLIVDGPAEVNDLS